MYFLPDLDMKLGVYEIEESRFGISETTHWDGKKIGNLEVTEYLSSSVADETVEDDGAVDTVEELW